MTINPKITVNNTEIHASCFAILAAVADITRIAEPEVKHAVNANT
jgi:hypothetical protein